MFHFEGIDYKSKSEVAKKLLVAGVGRSEIAKKLDIKYQTVHAIMKSMDVLSAPSVKKNEKSKNIKTTENTESSNVESV